MNADFISLIDKIEILNREYREVMSAEELTGVENKIGHQLPADYKYFCQRLGTGRATGFIDFYSPIERRILEQNEAIEYAIGRIQEDMKNPVNSHTDIDVGRWNFSEKIELLKSAFLFGMFNSEAALLWDLRTYQSSDDSYDIYWYNFDIPESYLPIKVGRSFAEFFCNFCYGQLACDLIPEFCVDGKPISIEYIFYSFQE
jgi:hypothetical protein